MPDNILEPRLVEEQINALGAVLRVQRRPSESLLGLAYVKLDQQNLLPIVWHENVPSLSWILESSKRADNVYYACLLKWEGSETHELAGVGWLVDVHVLTPGKITGSVGMVFFGEFQQSALTREFCRMMLDDGFDNLGLQAAYGFAPIQNRAACLFHRRMKFEVLATLPCYSTWEGEVCDVQVSVMTAERWNIVDLMPDASPVEVA